MGLLPASRLPGACLSLGTGAHGEGDHYPIHHPKGTFNEWALFTGAALCANCAIQWLKNHK